jgi:hypothetical protein
MEDTTANRITLCPSARPESMDGIVFGIVGGTTAAARIAYLKQPLAIADELVSNRDFRIKEAIFPKYWKKCFLNPKSQISNLKLND